MSSRHGLTLFSTIGGDYRLLDAFLDHYRQLGVDRIVLCFHLPGSEQAIAAEVREVVERHGAIIGSIWRSDALDHVRRYSEMRRLVEEYCGPQDWIIIADVDEFQIYPGGVAAAIQACIDGGCDYVDGRLIDRVAEQGDLPELDGRNLWRQFPIETTLTASILGGADTKIGLARARVAIGPAQHKVLSGDRNIGCPAERAFAHVHHFKWDAGVVERLKRRILALRNEGRNWWVESQAFLDYLSASGGRVNLADPRIHARRSEVFGLHR